MAENLKDLKDLTTQDEDEKILERARMKEDEKDEKNDDKVETIQNDNDSVGLIIDDDDEDEAPAKEDEDEKKYDGKGVVIEKTTEEKDPKGVVVGPMASEDRRGEVEARLSEMDQQIAEQREIAERRVKDGSAPKMEVNDPNASEDIKKHNRSVRDEEKKEAEEKKDASNKIDPSDSIQVIIDKSGMGSYEFTPEEKKRISLSKRIHVVEVEDRSLKTLNVKKNLSKKTDFKILKRNFDKSYSAVVALASGYTCKMKNLSAQESIRMYQSPGDDTANSILDKWSVIYDKMTDVSTGDFKDFEDFCKNTAFMDYDSFLYALICSSYPEDDSITFTCNKDNGGCGKEFTFKYQNKQMIRTDLISDDTKAVVSKIVNASAFQDKAKEVAEESPVHCTKRFLLDENTNIIVEIYVPSVYETVENVFRKMQDNRDLVKEDNRTSVVIAQSIKAMYIPDYEALEENPDAEISYYKVTDLETLVDIINQMDEIQVQIVWKQIDKFTRPYMLKFGFKDIECPNCHKSWGEYDMQLDSAIFRRVQARINTEIE